MEYQGVIRSGSEMPLGTIESVEVVLGRLLPGMTFDWSPTGLELLARLDSKGENPPALVRKILTAQQSTRGGRWSNKSLELTVNLGNGGPVDCIWLTLSGDDAAGSKVINAFRRLGWSLDTEKLEVTEVAAEDDVKVTGRATLFFERE